MTNNLQFIIELLQQLTDLDTFKSISLVWQKKGLGKDSAELGDDFGYKNF